MIKRVAILARVSTGKKDQAESPDRQLEQGREWAKGKSWRVVLEKVETVSGAKGERDRPGLAAIMDAARGKRIDFLWVARLDRLGRSLKNLLEVADELKELGVGLVVADLGGETLDTSTVSGRLLFQVLGAVAEFLRGLYAAAAAAGKERARAMGKIVNRHREVLPIEHRKAIDLYIYQRDRSGAGWSWGLVAKMLKKAKMLQPGKAMADGTFREPKAWQRDTLKRVYGRPAVEVGKVEE